MIVICWMDQSIIDLVIVIIITVSISIFSIVPSDPQFS